MDFGFTASYAYSNHPWFGMKAHTGLALTLAREAVGESLVALGAGVLFPVNPRLTAGFALRNLGPAVGGFDLPAAVQAGVAFTDDPDETGVRMALDFGYGLIDRLTSVKVGAEAFLNPVTILRAGYSRFFEDQGFEDASGLTAGLGVRIGAFGLDYAYQPFGRLARSHRFAVVYRSSSR